MAEALFYLATSFWLGALHAATPGHGKTIAASYIVGVRGRPIDAFVLGLFVTLSHTSGIVLVAVLATLGSTWLIGASRGVSRRRDRMPGRRHRSLDVAKPVGPPVDRPGCSRREYAVDPRRVGSP